MWSHPSWYADGFIQSSPRQNDPIPRLSVQKLGQTCSKLQGENKPTRTVHLKLWVVGRDSRMVIKTAIADIEWIKMPPSHWKWTKIFGRAGSPPSAYKFVSNLKPILHSAILLWVWTYERAERRISNRILIYEIYDWTICIRLQQHVIENSLILAGSEIKSAEIEKEDNIFWNR